MTYIRDREIVIEPMTELPKRAHRFNPRDIDAVDAALAARRPLLLRGEPGAGKSQLAEAAAVAMGRAFVSYVVDARTEVRDLHWSVDLVRRLADAQAREERDLALENYVIPGPLWWALDWTKALERHPAPPQPDARCKHENGVVVLIDEIDKADPDLPNGMLEVLGTGSFTPHGYKEPILALTDRWPLIVITTNRERTLPDAFIRRCVVHDIILPEGDDLEALLRERGHLHFPEADADVVASAAKMTVEDRNRAKTANLFPLPGQAEFIDLLRAVHEFPDPLAQLERLGDFFLKKKTDAAQ